MDKEYIRSRLPKEPPPGLVKWAIKKNPDEFGPEYMIYHCERVPVYPDLGEIMEYQTLAPKRTTWAAICDCTACQERFETTKIPGQKAISMVQGEDGVIYTLDPGGVAEDWGNFAWAMTIQEGDSFNCPKCLRKAQLIHSKYLTGGRTKQLLVTAVQNIEQYTAIIYWLVYRWVDEFGLSETGAKPADAYVLDEEGEMIHYTCIRHHAGFYAEKAMPQWRLASECKDAIDQIYHDWGSINNRKQGADTWPNVPDLTGYTGEKTGLVEYSAVGGWLHVQYLKLWQKHRSIENLCKTICAPLVKDIVAESHRFSWDLCSEAGKYIDLSQSKPNRMLRIPKEDFCKLRDRKVTIDLEDMKLYEQYRQAGGKMPFIQLYTASEEFRKDGIRAMIQLIRTYGDADIEKLRRYMQKQKMPLKDVGVLLDARRMAKQHAEGRALTPEEMWPRNLPGTHERLLRMNRAKHNEKDAATQAKIDAAFQRKKEAMEALPWSDGDLCVVLPSCELDLIKEGDVLRHCVGGYAEAHISGEDTIFFIRHYRRPERSYYTLDIDMTDLPEEKQLHGYGNERHGLNKEYHHKIPQRVRDFCNRWKQEILMPWYVKQKKQEDIVA